MLQEFVHHNTPSPDDIEDIRNWEYSDEDYIEENIYYKPYGGMWTSPVDSNNKWQNWAYEGIGPEQNLYHLMPVDNVRILHIEDEDVYRDVLDEWGRDPVDAIDFESVFAEYDGIHLHDGDAIEGWSVESVVWDGWHFTDVERIETVE